MELPHLTLALRRMRRTPGRTAITILLCWLALVLLESNLPNWPVRFLNACFSTNMAWLAVNYLHFIYLSIVLAGFFVLYLAIANGMRTLVDDVRGGLGSWYLTPVPSSRVLLGVLAGTALATVVPAVGLLAYLPLAVIAQLTGMITSYEYPGQLGLDNYSIYTFTLFLLLRLPHFALFAGCVQLALRQTRLVSFIPLLLALAATFSSLWQGRELYANKVAQDLGAQALWVDSIAGAVVVMALLILALLSERSWLGHAVVLVGAIVIPLAMGISAGVAGEMQAYLTNYTGGNLGWSAPPVRVQSLAAALAYDFPAMPFHTGLGHAYPNLEHFWTGQEHQTSWYTRQLRNREEHLFGQPIHPYGEQALAQVTGGYLLTLVLWWFTALCCLEIARRPYYYRRWRW
ncbi:hypothetical protein JW859_11715 [bacterium]|nr:hypothetical protein [bacterium]